MNAKKKFDKWKKDNKKYEITDISEILTDPEEAHNKKYMISGNITDLRKRVNDYYNSYFILENNGRKLISHQQGYVYNREGITQEFTNEGDYVTIVGSYVKNWEAFNVDSIFNHDLEERLYGSGDKESICSRCGKISDNLVSVSSFCVPCRDEAVEEDKKNKNFCLKCNAPRSVCCC